MIEQTISKRKEQQEQQQQTPPSDIETKAAVESKIVWIQKDNEKISQKSNEIDPIELNEYDTMLQQAILMEIEMEIKKKKEDQERQLLQ